MQDAEDIAFQRAILAAPDDTTLKLVYADWLQDRADPRAEFVRRQVQLGGLLDPASGAQAAGVLGTLGEGLDPAWVAFMTTLAQPFVPVHFDDELFTDPVGRRGQVATFASQFRSASDWSEGLLADLAFLAGNRWGVTDSDGPGYTVVSVLCACPAGAGFQTEDEVKALLPLAPVGRHGTWPDEVTISPSGTEWVAGWDEQLRAHVVGGCRYEVERPLREGEGEGGVESRPYRIGLTFGRSRFGPRLVGALWWHWG